MKHENPKDMKMLSHFNCDSVSVYLMFMYFVMNEF